MFRSGNVGNVVAIVRKNLRGCRGFEGSRRGTAPISPPLHGKRVVVRRGGNPVRMGLRLLLMLLEVGWGEGEERSVVHCVLLKRTPREQSVCTETGTLFGDLP